MDIGRAFAFVFDDRDWITKILLGALISLIPIVGQLVIMGYAITVLRNVKAGEERPLPDWSAFSSYLVDGLKFLVVTLIYAIPLIIIACPLMLVWLLPALAGGREELAGALAGIAAIATTGFACIAVLYGILMALLTPVLQIRYAETGQIAPCLKFGESIRYLTHNIGTIIVATLLALLVGNAVTAVLGAVSLGLLALPAGVWVAAFSSHLYGQVARGDELRGPG